MNRLYNSYFCILSLGVFKCLKLKMQKISFYIILINFFLSCSSSSILVNSSLETSNHIRTYIDLNKVKEDKIPIEINPGKFKIDTVFYLMPKVVQGTYAISNFGSYVSNFKAYGYDGNILKSVSKDENTWMIFGGKKLDKITYDVDDTFDIENVKKEAPFSPSGTNIELDNFMLNLYGFIGYFKTLTNSSYELNVTSKSSFSRSSALPIVAEIFSDNNETVLTKYMAKRYFDLADNPMMYGKLDVEEFMVDDIKIVLSVYSPNKLHSAESLKETVKKMMSAQKKYLGVIETTSRYDIFLYLAGNSEDSPTGLGALEHHKSTVVVLLESFSSEMLEKSIIDVVAHEFFHILTPLSIHSEDIHYFDYNNPTFSKHLWMYEGVTEYFAQHFQVNQGLISSEDFFNVVMDKIRLSKSYDDSMSFTNMSENILEEPFASNYYNVYLKGALIGMCIDILLRNESEGSKGILSMMKDLSNKYGKNKPFKDDLLFSEIEDITYPSVREFIDNHVIGEIPINYNDFFELLGLELKKGKVKTNYIRANGSLILRADPENDNIYFNSNVSNNSFWTNQGIRKDDLFKSIDGSNVSINNINSILSDMYQWKPGEKIKITIERDGKEKIIESELTETYMDSEMIIESEKSSTMQKSILNSWLYN